MCGDAPLPPLNDAHGGAFFSPLMPQTYSKPPLSISDQISLLKQRGLSFQDKAAAEALLSRLNYYRLRGYWITFEESSSTQHTFKSGTRFEDVLALYRFDEEVRGRLLYCLGKLEVSLRTGFAYSLAMLKGPLAHRSSDYFDPGQHWKHSEALAKLDQDFQNSKEHFAEHIKNTYFHPPIWAAVEVMQFGQLSRWLKYCNVQDCLEQIASSHNIPQTTLFVRFVHSAAALRNICAHQNRLVHRSLSILPATPRKLAPVLDSWQKNERKPYNLLTLLAHVMQNIDSNLNLGTDLQALAEQHNISLHVLGFPNDWSSRPVWSRPKTP